MVTMTEEQNDTIARLLRHHHSTVYRVEAVFETDPKKIGTRAVHIHCGGRNWFECHVSVNGVAFSKGGGMGNVVPLGVYAA
jgi:hypothetical protein